MIGLEPTLRCGNRLRLFPLIEPISQQRFHQGAELTASFKQAHLYLAPDRMVNLDGHLRVIRVVNVPASRTQWPKLRARNSSTAWYQSSCGDPSGQPLAFQSSRARTAMSSCPNGATPWPMVAA